MKGGNALFCCRRKVKNGTQGLINHVVNCQIPKVQPLTHHVPRRPSFIVCSAVSAMFLFKSHPRTISNYKHIYMLSLPSNIYFLPFLPPTPLVNLPRLPKLDFGLCIGPLGGGALCTALPALEGRIPCPCFGPSDSSDDSL